MTYAAIAEQAGVTSVWIGKLRADPRVPLRPLEIVRAARRMGVLEAVIAGLPSVQKLQGALRAVEVARLEHELTGQQMDQVLAVGSGGYSHLCERERERTDWSLLSRMMRFLAESPQQVLEREGTWQKLTEKGRVLAPAMLRKGLGTYELAQKSDTDDEAVRGTLYGQLERRDKPGKREAPNQKTVDKWADVLELTAAEEGLLRRLRHAARSKPPQDQPLHLVKNKQPRVRKVLDGQVARKRLTQKELHTALSEQGRQGYQETIAPLQETLADDYERKRQFEAVRRRRQRAHFASATPEEKFRQSLSAVRIPPELKLGLCREGRTLTFAFPPRRNLTEAWRSVAAPEFHPACQARWKHTGGPKPSYPEGRRMDSGELRLALELSVLYWRTRAGLWSGSSIGRTKPASIAGLVKQLLSTGKLLGVADDAGRDLRRRARRIGDLLPAPSDCSPGQSRLVMLLRTLRTLASDA
jgi:hypothetical protein